MINRKPAAAKLPVLAQLCKLIPTRLTTSLAKKHRIDKQDRTFSAWSHVVTLLFAQLTHATSLNDVCDALRNHCPWLGSLRGATAPPCNTLSHANKTRDSDMMEELFWKTLRLFALHRRGVQWVTRAKDNMARRKLLAKPTGKILRDDLILLKGVKSRSQYPEFICRVEMLVEDDGKEVVMAFITNNTGWAATSVGELYQSQREPDAGNSKMEIARNAEYPYRIHSSHHESPR